MLNTLKKTGILLVLASLLAGCATTQKLKKPMLKSSRIAVVTNFHDAALFQRIGTTALDNASFYRHIPGLKMNALMTTTVANDLYRTRQFKVIPIYHRTAPELLNIRAIKHGKLIPEYRDYLARLTRGKKLNSIVLITPGNIDFGKGQYLGAVWWARGYGLFNRSFVFMETNTVFSAYNVYVIDASNYKILAKTSGNFQVRTHGINITWHKGYAGVTPKTLATIRRLIRKRMPASLTSLIHTTGLP